MTSAMADQGLEEVDLDHAAQEQGQARKVASECEAVAERRITAEDRPPPAVSPS